MHDRRVAMDGQRAWDEATRVASNGGTEAALNGPTWVELGESIRRLAADLMDEFLRDGSDPGVMEVVLGRSERHPGQDTGLSR